MIKEHDVMDCIAKLNLHNFERIVILSTLFVGLVLVLLVTPVFALSESGWLGDVGSITTTTHGLPDDQHFAPPSYGNISGLLFLNIENSQNSFSVVSYIKPAYGTFPKTSDYLDVTLYSGNTPIGTGGLGYNYNLVTGHYVMFFNFYSWNPGALTGNHIINFTTANAASSWNGLGETLGFRSTRALSGTNYVGFMAGTSTIHVQSVTGAGEPALIYNKLSPFFNYWSIETFNTFFTRVNVSKQYEGLYYTSKVYVMSGNTIAASESAYGITNYSGVFYQTPISVNILDIYSRWWNTSSYYGVTPTYTISVTPSQIAPSANASGQIISTTDPTLSAIFDIGWKWSDASSSYYNEFYDNGNISRPLLYSKKGATWYGWDNIANDYVVNKGATIPNPITLSGITSSGDKIIRCVVFTSDGNAYILTAPLTVGTSTSQTVTTGAKLIDALTGNYITGGTISFQNIATGVWTNQTTTPTGTVYVSSSPTVKWNLVGTASGYIPVSRLGLDSSSGSSVNTYSLTMYPSSYTPAPGGETTLLATVTSVCQQQYQGACSDLPLGGVTITIRSVDGVTFSQSATTGTGTSGIITMFIPNNTAYFWGASGKPGYQDVSGNFTVNAEPVYTLGIQMAQIFVTPTPSLAPGQTPMPTGVTPTTTKGVGQSEGEFQAGRAIDALAGALWGWVQIGIGVVSLWLLWILVYEMTGGKVIEKIMRRGRNR